MPTTTANLGLTLPTPNVDTGWGSTLNTDFTLIDNLFAAGGTGTSVGLNVGSGKTLGISGTLLLGGGDGTGTTTVPQIRGPSRTGTNAVGTNIYIDAANGTGTGGSGYIVFRTAPAAAGGTTANVMRDTLYVHPDGNVTFPAKADPYATNSYVASALGPYATTSYVNSAVAGVVSATTANVLNATAAASAGAVGTYAFLRHRIVPTASNPGDTFAGSSLYWSSGSGSATTSLSPAGSWRALGQTSTGVNNDGAATLFLRYA